MSSSTRSRATASRACGCSRSREGLLHQPSGHGLPAHPSGRGSSVTSGRLDHRQHRICGAAGGQCRPNGAGLGPADNGAALTRTGLNRVEMQRCPRTPANGVPRHHRELARGLEPLTCCFRDGVSGWLVRCCLTGVRAGQGQFGSSMAAGRCRLSDDQRWGKAWGSPRRGSTWLRCAAVGPGNLLSNPATASFAAPFDVYRSLNGRQTESSERWRPVTTETEIETIDCQ